MKKQFKNYLFNLIFPAIVLGSATGISTAVVITLYKFCAKHIIHFSETGYHYLREHLYFIPVVLVVLFLLSFLMAYIYKKVPNLRGGGIPTSIAVLRGIITFKWFRNLIGVFFLSLTSFLVGVPLGNEGPSVQMGTAIGRGTVSCLAKNHRAWDRYSMTGGAAAGFAVATGSPVSGIMFAIEEAHQRVSPMIIIVSAVSVLFAGVTSELLAPIFNVETNLFPGLELPTLHIQNIWIPILVGVIIGLFAVLFLNYYRVINAFFDKVLKKIPHQYKIFFVFAITLILGLCSQSFVSTGHELILSIFEEKFAIYMLILILILRSTLTLCANTNKLTGGIFIPLLTLGAVLAAVVGATMERFFDLDSQYYLIIIALGITACIASLMQMPITAVVFAVEALGLHKNILYVIVVSAVAFIITEIFEAKSINDTVIEDKIEELNESQKPTIIDTHITINKKSFAIGKQIRDILWPANLFVLSLTHDETKGAVVDGHGGKILREGDILHIRYSTYNEQETKEELISIVGKQDYDENEVNEI